MADVISACRPSHVCCVDSLEVYLESVRQTSKKLQEKSLLSLITAAIYQL